MVYAVNCSPEDYVRYCVRKLNGIRLRSLDDPAVEDVKFGCKGVTAFLNYIYGGFPDIEQPPVEPFNYLSINNSLRELTTEDIHFGPVYDESLLTLYYTCDLIYDSLSAN